VKTVAAAVAAAATATNISEGGREEKGAKLAHTHLHFVN